jgi:hypothetical protein
MTLRLVAAVLAVSAGVAAVVIVMLVLQRALS